MSVIDRNNYSHSCPPMMRLLLTRESFPWLTE